MANDTRQRLLTAAAEHFKVAGYTGTGVKQIVADASAPFPSLYHFFPGGKEELGAETIRWSGALYGLLGLGLSLSYGIIQKHGGQIDVRSAPGCGTTFRIALPIRRAPEQVA